MRMRVVCLCALVAGLPALADVSLTTGDVVRGAAKVSKKRPVSGRRALAEGSISLVDASGLKYFINTHITFSTSSNASAAMSEASYTHAVSATTSGGGHVSSQLNDMFDGYNAICVNIGATQAMPCETGASGWVFYNKNAAPTLDPASGGRQYDFPVQTIGGLQVSRKVYVPAADSYARWMNIFTNPTGAPITVRVGTGNNLGSDGNTRITGTSSGTIPPTTADTWVATFQNYGSPTPTTSSDPRIGHILQGPGGRIPLSSIHFANGDDNPFWSYDFTVPPGTTRVIVNYVTGQPSKTAAAAKAASLAAGAVTTQGNFMSPVELGGILNFGPFLSANPIPFLSPSGLLLLGAALSISAFAVLRKSVL